MDEHPGRLRLVRDVAVAASVAAALLYLLIAFGVVSVGTATEGVAPDLLGFGLTVGGAMALTALALWLFRSRLVWLLVAALEVIVLVGYFALAYMRSPSYEPWGLLIKACQAVVLVAVLYLALRGPEAVRSLAARR